MPPQSIIQSQLLTYLAAGVFILLALAVFAYVIRQLIGRKIRSPGPRNRPRRLDVVDVFDLDRERQLVIVRRDNIEHLLLIGGPNDVLVESAIHRGEPVAVRAEPREARPTALAPGWPPAPSAPEAAVPPPPSERPQREAPTPPGRTPMPALRESPPPVPGEAVRRRPAPEPARPPLPTQAPQPAHPEPLPPDLFAPEPPRPQPQPQPVEAAPQRPAAAAPSTESAPPQHPQPPRQPGVPPLRPLSPRPPAPPFLARTQKVAPPPPKREPPPAAQRPAAPPPAPPATPEPERAPPPEEKDALESLEAEMARLLGRPEN